jgi:hypothetical protein
MTPQEVCQYFLERTKPYEDCLLWQGAINDKGLAVSRVPGDSSKIVKVHRYLKLYEVERSGEQINRLSRMNVRHCERFTHCLNTKHLIFRERGEGPRYESMPDWRQVYGTDIKGLAT